MDFMKVFDQTMREIKREVNLKVLKVPEIEQKVLDATSDEPWGPHGSALAEIAKETNKFTECQMIMNVLWTRLADTGANWRHVYKALAVIEYLISNGSERAVDDIIEHTFQISSLSGFEYMEANGKDMGINVRKKAETVAGVLNNREKIKALRDKAAATRDKYFGLSSSGVTYKSSASAFGSSSFSQYDSYGGMGGSREGDRFKESYKDRDQAVEEVKRNHSNETDGKKCNNEVGQRSRTKSFSAPLKAPSKQNTDSISGSSTSQLDNIEDDIDDFNPRGSSSGPVSGSPKQVDPFGDSLLIDLLDEPSSTLAPAPAPAPATSSETSAAVETDLFADAAFVSAPPPPADVKPIPVIKEVDLFASHSATGASGSLDINLFDVQNPISSNAVSVPKKSMDSTSFDPFVTVTLGTEAPTSSPSSEETKSSSFDPFATVPLSTFDDSSFGAFTSHIGSMQPESSQDPNSNGLNNLNQTSSQMSRQEVKKVDFQVKSGIWADSLSRGLIDLNISAPKKVSLADIGIVGGLDDPSDEKEMLPPSSVQMGRAMGSGAGLGWSAFPSSAGTGGSGSWTNQQWGDFK